MNEKVPCTSSIEKQDSKTSEREEGEREIETHNIRTLSDTISQYKFIGNGEKNIKKSTAMSNNNKAQQPRDHEAEKKKKNFERAK